MSSAQRHAPRKPISPNRSAPPDTVDPVWLIKALALSLVAALICGYATICLLYYQGEWQLILHPNRMVDRTPASTGLLYTNVQFDAAETGQPRLTAWWIPAQSPKPPGAGYAAFTVLYLHDGSGSLADTVPMLANLHRAGFNVFAIDYRGFGASDSSVHPSATRMAQDAAAALDYLTSTRHIPSRSIVPYGVGLGAFLAANLARNHPDLPAVVLDNPDPDPLSSATAQQPRFIPVRLLSGHPFDVARLISIVATPKLLIAGGPSSTEATRDPGRLQALFQHAAGPSMAVTLPSVGGEGDYQAALKRFLGKYLPAQP
jgi:pimeloyl-ACP methyl ester carboxylesterase